MLPLVAIVGRPNVGKSTLFNRLVGARRALVADQPGLTRDRHYGTSRAGDRPFDLVDTGGLEPEADGGIEALIAMQTKIAIEEAQVIVAVWDARDGLTATDREIAALLRKIPQPVLHAANKVDGPKQHVLVNELYELGMERIFGVSAEHGLGLDGLLDAITDALPEQTAGPANQDDCTLRIALVGRPNAGKSALLNRLYGQARSIVSDVPGTTRDPVDVELATPEGPVKIVDTAGIRRKRRSGPALEQLAAIWSQRAIVDAEVACLVIDGEVGIAIQDARIANAAMEAGRAMVIIANKSDLLGPMGPARKAFAEQLEEKLGFAAFAPVLMLSAKTGKNCQKLLPTVRRIHGIWNKRVPTAELNRVFESIVSAHTPPAHRGRPVRFYYITQAQAAPPTFIVAANNSRGVPLAYRRYVANRLREAFGFEGAPLRLFFRQRKRDTAGSER